MKTENDVMMTLIYHVKWLPCHRCMACPQVVDEGDGLQILRVLRIY
jgi:hypothetical protein